MENTLRTVAIGGAATLIVIGGLVFTQLDNWFDTEPTGPGSGEEMERDPMFDGPGSGEFEEYDNPGSEDYNAGLEHDPVYDGPGSGDFDYTPEPTGPGSGEELPPDPEPTGPGSGDEIDPNEPTGPGSGDEVAPDYPGPGSGEEVNVIGSCNAIPSSSVCTDYIGSFWETPAIVDANCVGVGVYTDTPCPQPTSGGCNASAGTVSETIIWYYPYGGDPVTGDLITYAAGACNANPLGNYIFAN